MSSYSDLLNTTLIKASERKETAPHHTAMRRWFSCNMGVQNRSWPVVYKPTYVIKELAMPSGISESYWDTLGRAERHWVTDPIKSQFGAEVEEFWEQHHDAQQCKDLQKTTTAQHQLKVVPMYGIETESNFFVDPDQTEEPLKSNLKSADLSNIRSIIKNPAWKNAASW